MSAPEFRVGDRVRVRSASGIRRVGEVRRNDALVSGLILVRFADASDRATPWLAHFEPAELELVEVRRVIELQPAPPTPPQTIAVRASTSQRSCSKAREEYWTKKLAEAARPPLDVELQQRFLNWLGAGGGI